MQTRRPDPASALLLYAALFSLALWQAPYTPWLQDIFVYREAAIVSLLLIGLFFAWRMEGRPLPMQCSLRLFLFSLLSVGALSAYFIYGQQLAFSLLEREGASPAFVWGVAVYEMLVNFLGILLFGLLFRLSLRLSGWVRAPKKHSTSARVLLVSFLALASGVSVLLGVSTMLMPPIWASVHLACSLASLSLLPIASLLFSTWHMQLSCEAPLPLPDAIKPASASASQK